MNILLAVLVAIAVAGLTLYVGWFRRSTVAGLDGPLPAPKAVDKSALRAAEEAAEKRLERFRGR